MPDIWSPIRLRLPCLIGLDLGTTAIKAVAVSLDGRVVARHGLPTTTVRRADGAIEHPPQDIRAAVFAAIRAVVSGTELRPLAVAAASMGEAGAPVDHDGRVLRPIIAWLDTRATAQIEWLQQTFGVDCLYRVVGHALDPYWGIGKLLWFRDNEPELFARTRSWLSLADLAVLWLSGQRATAPSLASRQMAFDQRRREWWRDLLEAAELPDSLLPPVYASGTHVGAVTAGAAAETGLPPGLPVVVGGHDRICGAYAARGARRLPIDSAGTAETVVASLASYLGDGSEQAHRIACYADVVPDRYVFSARVGLAGALVEWARRELYARSDGGHASYEDMFAELDAPVAFGGVICYPTFGRFVTPYWDAGVVHGAFLGLTTNHERRDLLQAVLEAPCFSLRANLEELERATGEAIPTVRVEGGVVRNPTWMQLRADVTNRLIESVHLPDATAVGAALLAGVGAQCFQDHHQASGAVSPQLGVTMWEPDPERAATYDEVFITVYRRLPGALHDLSHAINRLGSRVR